MSGFLDAVNDGDVNQVKNLLSKATGPEKQEGLYRVILSGKFNLDTKKNLIELLVLYNADLNISNGKEKTALELTESTDIHDWITELHLYTSFFTNVKIGDEVKMRILLEEYPRCVDFRNAQGQTGLHIIVLAELLHLDRKKRMIDLLYSFNADMSAEDDEYNTPLHEACRLNSLELSKYLVIRGASTKGYNSSSKTPFELATQEVVTDWYKQQEKILQCQLNTQYHFFNFNRFKPAKRTLLSPYKEEYVSGYKLFDAKTINISSLNTRELIAVETKALSEMVGSYEPSNRDNLRSTLEKQKWAYCGESQFGFSSGVEKLVRDISGKDDGKYSITIRSQHNPTNKQMGNFRMFGDVGPYGIKKTKQKDESIKTTGVLIAIYEATTKDEDSSSEKIMEQNLANLFLFCLKNHCPITTTLLKQNELYYYTDATNQKRVVQLLNEVFMLTIKEAVRHFYGSSLKLPITIAYIQGLQLVADGHLSMKDIFDEDAIYGIPTGSSLSHTTKAADKTRALNALYTETYDAPITEEEMHQFLIYHFVGDTDSSDTDGDEYQSPGSKKNPLPRIKM